MNRDRDAMIEVIRSETWSWGNLRGPEHSRVAAKIADKLLALPVGGGVEEALAHVLWGIAKRSGYLSVEDIDRALELVTAPKPPVTDADRAWAERAAAEIAALSGHPREAQSEATASLPKPPVTADEGWRPIESAPRDGTEFIATVRVFSNSAFSHHDMHIVAVDDETGELANHYEQGWRLEDYEFWRPLPAPPTGEEQKDQS